MAMKPERSRMPSPSAAPSPAPTPPEGVGVPQPPAVAPFLTKLYHMVDDASSDDVISWGRAGNSFVIRDVLALSRDYLPRRFKHNNFSSFVRQLNTYGFRKVDPDQWEFANDKFLRGQRHLLKNIQRRKSSQNTTQQIQQLPKASSGNACVEVGNFGLEEELEMLKRDRNVLMQEVVKLRQSQQKSDLELHKFTHKIQVLERNQQRTLAFLAQIVQNPALITQMVNQLGNSRWRANTNSNKKKRLLEHNATDALDTSNYGQIVKYQPTFVPSVNNESAPTQEVPSTSLTELSNSGLHHNDAIMPDVSLGDLDANDGNQQAVHFQPTHSPQAFISPVSTEEVFGSSRTSDKLFGDAGTLAKMTTKLVVSDDHGASTHAVASNNRQVEHADINTTLLTESNTLFLPTTDLSAISPLVSNNEILSNMPIGLSNGAINVGDGVDSAVADSSAQYEALSNVEQLLLSPFDDNDQAYLQSFDGFLMDDFDWEVEAVPMEEQEHKPS